MYLHPDGQLKGAAASESRNVTFEAMGEGLTFGSEPLTQQSEITADLREVTFMGAIDPHTRAVASVSSAR